MSKRIVGIAKATGEEIPFGPDQLLVNSADVAAPGEQMRLEHFKFDIVDRPEMTYSDPYVALVLGEPLTRFKHNGQWHLHKFRYGQLSIKGGGDVGPFQSTDGCELVVVSLDTALMNQIAMQMELSRHFEIIDNITADSDFLHSLVLVLRNEVATGFPGGRLLYESLQTTLCAYLLTHHSNGNQTDFFQRIRTGGLDQQTLKRIEDYIAEHLQSDISLTELAQLAFMSTYHFSRMFKRATGYSPYSYLSNLRVRNAASLIQAGNTDIVQISQAVGFRDSRALYRQFKRIFGETPASYIKRFR
jgi:AraC family transcriptional regulator